MPNGCSPAFRAWVAPVGAAHVVVGEGEVGIADGLAAQPADFFETSPSRSELAGKKCGQRLDADGLDEVDTVQTAPLLHFDQRFLHIAVVVVSRRHEKRAWSRLGLNASARRPAVTVAFQSNSRLRATAARARWASARSSPNPAQLGPPLPRVVPIARDPPAAAKRRYMSADAIASPARASVYAESNRSAASNAAMASRVLSGV